MKAITLWQPWAQAICTGAKSYETRSWRCKYSGPLAIHAASAPVSARHAAEFARCAMRTSALGGEPIYALPRKAIVAVAMLVECIPTERIVTNISPREHALGDYRANRFAWRLINVVRLQEPVECPGKQGMWYVPDVDAVLAQMDSISRCKYQTALTSAGMAGGAA